MVENNMMVLMPILSTWRINITTYR